jgi:hypothetical protein
MASMRQNDSLGINRKIMSNEYRIKIISKLKEKYGGIENIGDGFSLVYIPAINSIIYFRYSKISYSGKVTTKTFYGLRKNDIDLMQGKKAFICFLTDDATKDIVIPFQQFENYFSAISPSSDGQYKASTIFKPTGAEFYLNNVGKFNAENYLGIKRLFNIEVNNIIVPTLTHSQLQSLVGSIGIKKGYDIWFPQNDKNKIDNSIVDISRIRDVLPNYGKEIDRIISEIDVIWLDNANPVSFYEVEHSTPIYSGLLRFNDVLLTVPGTENFNIIASNDRENKFGREINRPTFKQNRLIDKVTFLDYENIYNWYFHLYGKTYSAHC